MAHKEFLRAINEQSRLRILIVTERGKIRRFMVQLEALIRKNWVPVARYDTVHGFAHLDLLHPNRRQDKVLMQEADFNKALDVALTDLLENWETYFSQYIEEM